MIADNKRNSKVRFIQFITIFVMTQTFVKAQLSDDSALDQFKTFTLNDKRIIELRILDWHAISRRFQVKTRAGQKSWVLTDQFTESDQKYFKSWLIAKRFMSNSKFSVSAKRKEYDGHVFFLISMHNRTSYVYDNVMLKYQLEFILSKYGSNKRKNRNLSGEYFVGTIKPGEKKEIKTISVQLAETFMDATLQEPVMEKNELGSTYTNVIQRKTGTEKIGSITMRITGPKLQGQNLERFVIHKE